MTILTARKHESPEEGVAAFSSYQPAVDEALQRMAEGSKVTAQASARCVTDTQMPNEVGITQAKLIQVVQRGLVGLSCDW